MDVIPGSTQKKKHWGYKQEIQRNNGCKTLNATLNFSAACFIAWAYLQALLHTKLGSVKFSLHNITNSAAAY